MVWNGCATTQRFAVTAQIVHQRPDAVWESVSVERWLRAHPLPMGAPFTIHEISRTKSVSLHIAQIRTQELPHIHQAHDLTATVYRGTGELYVGNQMYRVQAGDTVMIPHGLRHYVINRGTAPLIGLVVISPPFDGYDVVLQD